MATAEMPTVLNHGEYKDGDTTETAIAIEIASSQNSHLLSFVANS